MIHSNCCGAEDWAEFEEKQMCPQCGEHANFFDPEDEEKDFDEPGEDNWKEELIEERGIEADDFNFY